MPRAVELSLPFARATPLEPAAVLARLRAEDPVARVASHSGEPAWLVTGYDDARTLLADRRFGLALPGVDTATQHGSNDSLFQDPPGHTRLRRLVSAAFTTRRVAELRSHVAELAVTLITEMDARQGPVDLMQALGFPLPITMIGELLGIAPGDRNNFHTWSDTLLSLPAGGDDPGSGWESLSAQIGELIARKRAEPGDDLLSALIAVRDADAGRLSEAELTMMAITLIPAGYVTTAIGIGIGTVLLTEHGQLARLAGNPALVPSAVEEILRYQAAAGDVARYALDDCEVAGVRIRAGEKVLISLVAASRDQRRFTDPDRFDIARPDNAHLTFGHGIHHCLGAALARLEMQVVFTELANRLPNVRLAVPAHDLRWQRSELFGDEWPQAVPVSW